MFNDMPKADNILPVKNTLEFGIPDSMQAKKTGGASIGGNAWLVLMILSVFGVSSAVMGWVSIDMYGFRMHDFIPIDLLMDDLFSKYDNGFILRFMPIASWASFVVSFILILKRRDAILGDPVYIAITSAIPAILSIILIVTLSKGMFEMLVMGIGPLVSAIAGIGMLIVVLCKSDIISGMMTKKRDPVPHFR